MSQGFEIQIFNRYENKMAIEKMGGLEAAQTMISLSPVYPKW